MDKKFFESVLPKGNQRFEDSSSKFYRFIPDQITEETVSKEYENAEKRLFNLFLNYHFDLNIFFIVFYNFDILDGNLIHK